MGCPISILNVRRLQRCFPADAAHTGCVTVLIPELQMYKLKTTYMIKNTPGKNNRGRQYHQKKSHPLVSMLIKWSRVCKTHVIIASNHSICFTHSCTTPDEGLGCSALDAAFSVHRKRA